MCAYDICLILSLRGARGLIDWVSFVRNNMQCKSYAHRIYTEQASEKTVMLHLSYLKPVQTRISFMFSASHASSCLVDPAPEPPVPVVPHFTMPRCRLRTAVCLILTLICIVHRNFLITCASAVICVHYCYKRFHL